MDVGPGLYELKRLHELTPSVLSDPISLTLSGRSFYSGSCGKEISYEKGIIIKDHSSETLYGIYAMRGRNRSSWSSSEGYS